MTIPNFLVIGAAKSGTTSLYHYLKQHPEVFLSEIKEPRFFAFEGQTLNFRGPGDAEYQQEIITDIDNYCSLFDEAEETRAIGEMSPIYLSQSGTAERIVKLIPNVKLIAILRQPAERAYSQFLMHRREGHEPLTDFASALEAEKNRLQDNWLPIWGYRQRGFYFQQLSRYYGNFPANQIRVYLYDDFINSPNKLLSDICEFLGIDTNFKFDMSRRHNVSQIPRYLIIHKMLIKPHLIKSVMEKIFPRNFRNQVRERLIQLNSNKRRPKLPLDIRRRLTSDYREDILQLQELIQRDLSLWLEK